MAINEQDGSEQETEETGGPSAGTPDPERGGCMRFGWGCLPLIAAVTVIPLGLLF